MSIIVSQGSTATKYGDVGEPGIYDPELEVVAGSWKARVPRDPRLAAFQAIVAQGRIIKNLHLVRDGLLAAQRLLETKADDPYRKELQAQFDKALELVKPYPHDEELEQRVLQHNRLSGGG